MTRRIRNDAGSIAVETVLVATVFIMAGLLIVGGGRIVAAKGDVSTAAQEAARAASLQRSTSAATTAGQDAAAASLADDDVECGHMTVHVDVSDAYAGGKVVATVSCTADLSDVAAAGFPGSKTFEAHAAAPIETYTAGDAP